MKSQSTFSTLLRFNIQMLPRFIWPMVAIFCLNSSIIEILGILYRQEPWIGDAGGIGTSLNALPIMFSGLLATQFFTGETPWGGTASMWLIPTGEFLLVRPISRRMAYFSRIFLYFIIILLPFLLKVSLTMAEPNLRLSLYHSKTQSTEAADKLNTYQDEFPNSSVIPAPKGGREILIIPLGATLIALWQLWLTVLLALALQMTTLLALPFKVQMGLLMAICFAPMFMMVFHLLGDPTMMLENVFFFFAHHWVLIALLTLGAFILVQRLALKRIAELEVL